MRSRSRVIKNNINLDDESKDINGKDKKTVVSFQINYPLWKSFDEVVEAEYGKYKKSLIIEDLIKKYMAKKNK